MEPRVPGGSDTTGMALPLCQPETHRDGKHSLLCFAACLGYDHLPDGTWERIPPDPMTVAGAVFRFEGEVYVKPVGRGVSLGDDAKYHYLEDLPDGHYDAVIEFRRR